MNVVGVKSYKTKWIMLEDIERLREKIKEGDVIRLRVQEENADGIPVWKRKKFTVLRKYRHLIEITAGGSSLPRKTVSYREILMEQVQQIQEKERKRQEKNDGQGKH